MDRFISKRKGGEEEANTHVWTSQSLISACPSKYQDMEPYSHGHILQPISSLRFRGPQILQVSKCMLNPEIFSMNTSF
jgi:hypothetical protein